MVCQLEHSKKLSEKYVSISTSSIKQELEKNGFHTNTLKQKARLGYHQVKFLNKNEDGFILENSYDGSRAFVVSFIKECGDDSFFAFGNSNLYQKHMGKPAEDLKVIFAEQIKFHFEKVKLLTDLMKSTTINDKIMRELFTYGFKMFRNNENHKIDLNEIVSRFETRNLYEVYAKLHKILNNGEYFYTNKSGKLRKARKVKNYQRYLKLSNNMYYYLIGNYPELSI